MDILEHTITFSDILSIGAIGISIYYGRIAYKLNKQNIKKNEEEFENEKKACIVATVKRTEKSWQLVITNKGKASARNVDFGLCEFTRGNEIFIQKDLDDFPVPELFSGDCICVNLMLGSRCSSYPKICLKWDDDYAKGRSKEQTVNLVV